MFQKICGFVHPLHPFWRILCSIILHYHEKIGWSTFFWWFIPLRFVFSRSDKWKRLISNHGLNWNCSFDFVGQNTNNTVLYFRFRYFNFAIATIGWYSAILSHPFMSFDICQFYAFSWFFRYKDGLISEFVFISVRSSIWLIEWLFEFSTFWHFFAFQIGWLQYLLSGWVRGW